MKPISTKPVKKCLGCALNMAKTCGIFEHPIEKWKNRHCEGFNNPELMARFEQQQHPEGAHRRQLERIMKAKITRTEPHWDGAKRPGHLV